MSQGYARRREESDRHAALVASVIANVHRGKSRPPFRLEDFMVHRQRKRQSWQDIKARFANAFGYRKV